MRRCRFAALSPLLVLLNLAPPATGADLEQSLSEVLEVRLVNIDVWAVDRDGRPIEGLTREDFILYEDEVPQEISNFYEAAGEGPPPVGAAQEAGRGAGDAPPLPAAGGESDSTSEPFFLVAYVDNYNLQAGGRNRVLGDVEAFLRDEMARPNRYAMVVAQQGGLKPLTGFTRDPAEIGAAFEAIRKTPADGGQVVRRRSSALTVVKEIYENPHLGCDGGFDMMLGEARQYASFVLGRTEVSSGRLADLAGSLGGVAGRKALIYVGDGLTQRPGIDFFQQLGEICPQHERETFHPMLDFDASRGLEQAMAWANSNRVTLYTIDAGGLRSGSTVSAQLDDRRFVPSSRNDFLRTSNLQSGLHLLANETGGTAIFNENRPRAALDRLAGDFSHYYSLGFAPARKSDGKDHRIRVVLKEKRYAKAQVRYRQRYRDKSATQRLAERTLAALLYGVESNPLEIEVEAVAEREGKRRVEVPVQILVPLDRLTSLGDGAGRKVLVRLLLTARDERDRRTAMREKLVSVDLAEGASDGDRHRFVVHMELPVGEYELGVGVRDEIGAEASFVRRHVVWKEKPPAG